MSRTPQSIATITQAEDLAPYVEEWDDLAVRCSAPYSAPDWTLAWWRNVAPAGAELRVILVSQGDHLLGVAPMFLHRRAGLSRYRLLGASCSSRTDLLALPGHEREAASGFALALSEAVPAPDAVLFEAVPSRHRWPALVGAALPDGIPSISERFSQPGPSLQLGAASFDEWLGAKSRNFRQGAGRSRRRLRAVGATIRVTTSTDDLGRDLQAFARLHYGRWRGRGGSGVLTPRIEAMLLDVGQRLLPRSRFLLWSLDVGGSPVASHLFMGAGAETSYWLGGFNEDWGHLQPTFVTLLAAVEHAFEAGLQRVDLGTGGQPYKYRFADANEPVSWTVLIPHARGPRAALARGVLVPSAVRQRSAEIVPQSVKPAARWIFGRWRSATRVARNVVGWSGRRGPSTP